MEMNLVGQFLIAMPSIVDPIFSRSLMFICEHGPHGTMGIIVNRPLDLPLSGFLKQIQVETDRQDIENLPVCFGGPVQTDRGFILHQPPGHWDSTLIISDQVGLTTSKDILLALCEGRGPEKLFISLGYSGWEAGQIENEIAHNTWLNVEADPRIIFDVPSKDRYQAAFELLGIDMSMLSGEMGHA